MSPSLLVYFLTLVTMPTIFALRLVVKRETDLRLVQNVDPQNITQMRVRLGVPVILPCLPDSSTPLPVQSFTWLTNTRTTLVLNASDDSGEPDYSPMFSVSGAADHARRILSNGSLLISEVTRTDAGLYVCTTIHRHGNSSMTTVVVKLDYSVIGVVTVYSLVVGLVSAAGFFLFAVGLGAARYFAYVCSKDERAKRRSFREVLTIIRSSSHMERLSAFRMAHFSTLRSTTMDQLVAFKTARVDALRTYKHATVLSMQQYLERMCDHYAAQCARLKRTCAARSERLGRAYAAQRESLEGRREARMRRMRANYRARHERIREYGSAQLSRLRDQYKTQQQHVLKLLELLDIGNCVNVIRDDCQATESAIFDADLATFDLPAPGDTLSARRDAAEDDAFLCSATPEELQSDDEPDDDLSEIDQDESEREDDMEGTRDVGAEYLNSLEDVIGEIAAGIEAMRRGSTSGACGGEPIASTSRGSAEEDGSGGSRFVSVTVSMRDLHTSSSTESVPPLEGAVGGAVRGAVAGGTTGKLGEKGRKNIRDGSGKQARRMGTRREGEARGVRASDVGVQLAEMEL